jgi:chromosome segregation ATPase
MERDLNQKRTERDRYEDTLANWQKRQELFLKNLEESTPDEKKELEQALKEVDFQTKSLEQRLARAEEAIIIQENRIAELQEQLDSAEAYVQQHLEL